MKLSGVGICGCCGRGKPDWDWQDRSRTANWDIATHTREPEGAEVLPERRVSMDGGRHQAHAAVKQIASGGLSVMESGDGGGTLVCADGGEGVLSQGAGAHAEYGAATMTRMLLGSTSAMGRAAPGIESGEVFCAVTGVGIELVRRDAARLRTMRQNLLSALSGRG